MPNISFCREIPLRYDVDVFIAGGGPAGCAAAVAAARNGAKVFLAEYHAAFGGLGTTGLVPAFMTFDDGEHFLAAGLGREILERMWKYTGVESLSIKVEALKRVYEDMLKEAGVDFVFGAQVIGLEMDENRIAHCVLAGKSGLYGVRAKVFIDGTGDADLAAWSGAPYEKGDEKGRVMATTLCALWSGIDFTKRVCRDDARVEDAYNDGVFERLDRHVPGIWQISDSVGGSNVGHAYDVDATDERSVTEALLYTRQLYDQYEAYYKKYLKGYENMEMIATGAMLGVRESRRIVGEYVLNLQDFLNQAVFEDEIGRFAYPVDIHASDNSKESHEAFEKEHYGYRYEKGESYGVPYRILLPKGVDNLLVAGRCVSTDRPMQSSIRVMPGCYITGQAAGVGAALAVKGNISPKAVDVRNVQKVLKGMGMYLPNYRG